MILFLTEVTKMAKYEYLEEQNTKDHFIREIDARCAWNKIKSRNSLAEKMLISPSALSRRLGEGGNPDNFTGRDIRKLVKLLCPDIGIILRWLGYKDADIKKWRETK